MDSTSSLSGEIISCNRQPQAMERRLRPQHEQPLKCPRCDSTHTKFCYYNNYSLSQPRYFCKTCRRYWTKGGSLRNVPVGGGCRKNKRSGGKKPAMEVPQMAAPPMPLNTLPTFPSLHLSHLNSLPGASHGLSLMDCMMENQTAAGQQSSAGHFFASGFGEVNHGLFSTPSYHGGSAAGFSAEGGHGGAFIEPYQSSKAHEKLLCLEWQQEQLGFPSGLSFWAGMMNGHGSSASNPLV